MESQSNPDETQAPSAKEDRGRSSVEFTYNDLEDTEQIVTAVRDLGGTGCSVEALAAKLKLAATGGGFRMKLYSARGFGTCEITRGQIELTDLGLRLVDSKHVKSARVEAFLRVPLYRQIFELLKGQQMPPLAAVERMMLQAGVAPKQKERARQVFTRSAKFAGFFDINPDRMVLPSNHEPRTAAPPAAIQPVQPAAAATERRGFHGDGGDGGDGIHPALLWLLRELPAPGTAMPPRRKDQLKAAFATNLDFIYPDPED